MGAHFKVPGDEKETGTACCLSPRSIETGASDIFPHLVLTAAP